MNGKKNRSVETVNRSEEKIGQSPGDATDNIDGCGPRSSPHFFFVFLTGGLCLKEKGGGRRRETHSGKEHDWRSALSGPVRPTFYPRIFSDWRKIGCNVVVTRTLIVPPFLKNRSPISRYSAPNVTMLDFSTPTVIGVQDPILGLLGLKSAVGMPPSG